jgi:hypothetical protein
LTFPLGLSATPARVSKKIRVPKEKTKHVSSYKGTGRSAFDKVSVLRADGSSTPVKSPSTPTETSSSEEDSTSEEESDYEDEDDEMPPPIDISTVSNSSPHLPSCAFHRLITAVHVHVNVMCLFTASKTSGVYIQWYYVFVDRFANGVFDSSHKDSRHVQ